MIQRELASVIREKLQSGKAIIIIGARQVGKTTLLKMLFSDNDQVVWLNGDELDVQQLFANLSSTRFAAFLGNKKLVIVDEAQRIPDIGLRLKLIVDQLPGIQLIVTGSSSFDLLNKVNEPLTGRKWEYNMYPLSFREMVNYQGLLAEKRMIPHRLVYGYYPEIVSNQGSEKELLKQLSESYLYKDIFLLESIKRPSNLVQLLQGLSFQVGSVVSYHELSKYCGLDVKTVEKYVTILERAFVVFRIPSFSRNLRAELKKSRKIYFYDNGIRNALISNFNQLENRADVGALWENFLMSERIKQQSYSSVGVNHYFWRTTEQKEIDLLEESGENLKAFEFKWNSSAKSKVPSGFLQAYPKATFQTISMQNVDEFLLENRQY